MWMRILGVWCVLGVLGCDREFVRAKTLAAGGRRTCVQTLEGQVRCWGGDEVYTAIFGEPTIYGSDRARLVEDISQPQKLVQGDNTAGCALDAQGGVRCWEDDEKARSLPILDLPPVQHLASGISDMCAMTASGEAYCWKPLPLANNQSPRAERRESLRSLEGIGGVEQFEMGFSSQCVRTRQGEVWCWGSGSEGQLGYVPAEPSGSEATPKRVPGLSGVAEIALGGAILPHPARPGFRRATREPGG